LKEKASEAASKGKDAVKKKAIEEGKEKLKSTTEDQKKQFDELFEKEKHKLTPVTGVSKLVTALLCVTFLQGLTSLCMEGDLDNAVQQGPLSTLTSLKEYVVSTLFTWYWGSKYEVVAVMFLAFLCVVGHSTWYQYFIIVMPALIIYVLTKLTSGPIVDGTLAPSSFMDFAKFALLVVLLSHQVFPILDGTTASALMVIIVIWVLVLLSLRWLLSKYREGAEELQQYYDNFNEQRETWRQRIQDIQDQVREIWQLLGHLYRILQGLTTVKLRQQVKDPMMIVKLLLLGSLVLIVSQYDPKQYILDGLTTMGLEAAPEEEAGEGEDDGGRRLREVVELGTLEKLLPLIAVLLVTCSCTLLCVRGILRFRAERGANLPESKGAYVSLSKPQLTAQQKSDFTEILEAYQVRAMSNSMKTLPPEDTIARLPVLEDKTGPLALVDVAVYVDESGAVMNSRLVPLRSVLYPAATKQLLSTAGARSTPRDLLHVMPVQMESRRQHVLVESFRNDVSNKLSSLPRPPPRIKKAPTAVYRSTPMYAQIYEDAYMTSSPTTSQYSMLAAAPAGRVMQADHMMQAINWDAHEEPRQGRQLVAEGMHAMNVPQSPQAELDPPSRERSALALDSATDRKRSVETYIEPARAPSTTRDLRPAKNDQLVGSLHVIAFSGLRVGIGHENDGVLSYWRSLVLSPEDQLTQWFEQSVKFLSEYGASWQPLSGVFPILESLFWGRPQGSKASESFDGRWKGPWRTITISKGVVQWHARIGDYIAGRSQGRGSQDRGYTSKINVMDGGRCSVTVMCEEYTGTVGFDGRLRWSWGETWTKEALPAAERRPGAFLASKFKGSLEALSSNQGTQLFGFDPKSAFQKLTYDCIGSSAGRSSTTSSDVSFAGGPLAWAVFAGSLKPRLLHVAVTAEDLRPPAAQQWKLLDAVRTPVLAFHFPPKLRKQRVLALSETSQALAFPDRTIFASYQPGGSLNSEYRLMCSWAQDKEQWRLVPKPDLVTNLALEGLPESQRASRKARAQQEYEDSVRRNRIPEESERTRKERRALYERRSAHPKFIEAMEQAHREIEMMADVDWKPTQLGDASDPLFWKPDDKDPPFSAWPPPPIRRERMSVKMQNDDGTPTTEPFLDPKKARAKDIKGLNFGTRSGGNSSVITVHMGSHGCQIGEGLWRRLSAEHCISTEGFQKPDAFGLAEMHFYESKKGQKPAWSPRAVVFDTGDLMVDDFQRLPRDGQYHLGLPRAASNVLGPLRRQMEMADWVTSILWTGSPMSGNAVGLRSTVDEISTNVGKVPLWGFVQVPYEGPVQCNYDDVVRLCDLDINMTLMDSKRGNLMDVNGPAQLIAACTSASRIGPSFSAADGGQLWTYRHWRSHLYRTLGCILRWGLFRVAIGMFPERWRVACSKGLLHLPLQHRHLHVFSALLSYVETHCILNV